MGFGLGLVVAAAGSVVLVSFVLVILFLRCRLHFWQLTDFGMWVVVRLINFT